ncbi:MAG TPA: phosphoenolpyruvate--protein phosphotransferase, partial [Actinomycetales bacterium]|nr:phosphoenolpyruvate--protein phosphotransferase [Actinomycetales bacterium]
VRRLRAPAPDPAGAPPSGDPGAEWDLLVRAVDQVQSTTASLRDATARDVGGAEAGIFDAHLALLADDALLTDARQRVDAGSTAAAGWAAAVDRVHTQVAALPDPYLRARAADVRAVGDQVLRVLLGTPPPRPSGTGVLVAADLTPEQAAGLDEATVRAVVLAGGSPTSHAAILARARGIPAVVGAGPQALSLPEGTLVALDGEAGTVVVRPDDDVVADHERRRVDRDRRRAAALAAAAAPARTTDGTAVRVACNVGSVQEARVGTAQGAEGSGLVRTELCFVGRAEEPDVEEQHTLYLELARALGGHRMTLRTLDVGGDKPLPYIPVPHEDNPFLGLRGLRLGLAREQVLGRQLTAIARTARQTPVDVMFPMVSTVEELRQARHVLDGVLAAEGVTAADGLRVGIMVEVPAAALKAAAFAGLLDFVSIGTNDLTQYALAAERGNPHVAGLSDALDPGVLQLIGAVGRAGQGRFDVAVCGEAASDEVAVPLLLGLGVTSLSVAPSAVATVKQRVRGLDLPACEQLARRALVAASSQDVRALVRAEIDPPG